MTMNILYVCISHAITFKKFLGIIFFILIIIYKNNIFYHRKEILLNKNNKIIIFQKSITNITKISNIQNITNISNISKITKYIYPKQPTYVIADIHGDFDLLKYKLKKFLNCILIIAGDCGIGFLPIKEELIQISEINEKCVEQNIQLFLIRGNHDNPNIFNNENHIQLSNIKTIPDYSIISIGNENILCIGGAISEDRALRKAQMNFNKDEIIYWKNEYVKFNETRLNELNKINIDHIISHCGPKIASIKEYDTYKKWMRYDSNLENEIIKEREILDKVLQFLLKNKHKIKSWSFGHYHYENYMEYKGIKFNSLPSANNDFKFIEIIKGN